MTFEHTIDLVSQGVELAGVAILIVGGLYSLGGFAQDIIRGASETAYDDLRRKLGGSILVGLEVLVGADIIRTIAVSPSFTSVGVLGLVVVVRTFLSFSLEAELDGQWPWHRKEHEVAGAVGEKGNARAR